MADNPTRARAQVLLFCLIGAGLLLLSYAQRSEWRRDLGIGTPARFAGRSSVLGNRWGNRWSNRPREAIVGPRFPSTVHNSVVVFANHEQIHNEIKKMRAREIKEELANFGVDTAGIVEKEELVRLLISERMENTPANEIKKSVESVFEKATNKAQEAVDKVRAFDIKAEIEIQAKNIKAQINQNVEWYDPDVNPRPQKNIIKRQRGFRKD
eukprot:CAMPEP_0167751210 /NCGR_PEP_ID=MMETSP0110_2-20121227/6432_1 /TAXON_ID=629695 /ORGANISM="Gymnochlora sp., Strain CCMP2014" /LENGTH=210 /DNA_ID=CAMNT_0007636641 /DNA_START=140 /DNA_END=772 /DNA_ORIENTATION=-